MSINPKNRTTPSTAATPAPRTEPVAVQSLVIEHRPASERNGYLDPDQTLINFAVRELGYSFERIIKEDPNRLLRSWGKVYRKAKTTAIGTATLGACAVILGVLTGATPMLVAGVLVAGASGLLVKRHAAGVESCDIEHEVLDDCRPVLAFLAELERRGVNPSDLVSLYDRAIKRVSVNPGRFSSASILQKLFKDEVEQSGVLAQVSGVKTGLASVSEPQAMEGDRLMALPESQTIGMNTRLGAIPAAVQPEEMAPNARAQGQQNIAESLAQNIQSTLFVGMPGAGKGMLIAMAIREVKRLHPDIKIWAIDPKGDKSEAWYWEPCDHYLPLCLNPFASPEEVNAAIKDSSQFIRSFVDAGDTPKLLIIDEALALKEKASKWFKDLMTGFNVQCSMGRSSRAYGWMVSQSPNAEGWGIDASLRNVYRRILIIDQSNLGILDNGSTFFSGKPSQQLLDKTGRAYYDSALQEWRSLPQWSKSTEPVMPVANPVNEPQPEGGSRRLMLERAFQQTTEVQDTDSGKESEKPDLPQKEILTLAIQLKDWIEQNPNVEDKKWYAGFHAHRKGLSRPNFRYLLTLIEE